MTDIGSMNKKTKSQTRPRVFTSAPQEDGRLQTSQNKRVHTESEVELTGSLRKASDMSSAHLVKVAMAFH
jgi:hypothetical protein